jgi:hypothetical protein
MALPGGSADKLGNRYEGRWTVVCMARVLHDRAEAIELEPPRLSGSTADARPIGRASADT